jgi:hypothetical protein
MAMASLGSSRGIAPATVVRSGEVGQLRSVYLLPLCLLRPAYAQLHTISGANIVILYSFV